MAAPNPHAPATVHGSAYERVIDALDAHGSKRGSGGMWPCPAHADKKPSLSVKKGDDRALLYCFAGCELPAIAESLDLPVAAMFDHYQPRREMERRSGNPRKRLQANKPKPKEEKKPRCWTIPDEHVEDFHDYADEEGEPLRIEFVRFKRELREKYNAKGYWRHQDEADKWWTTRGPNKDKLPLFYRHAAGVRALELGGMVYLTEGQGDTDAIEAVNGRALTSGGAKTFGEKHAEAIEEAIRASDGKATLVILADKDEPGIEAARKRLSLLRAAGVPRACIQVKQAAVGNDVSDHLSEGNTLAELEPVEVDDQAEAEAPKRLRAATFEEVMADTTPDAVVDRLLYEGTPTLYFGRAKGGKSYSAAQLSVCIAAGVPFLGLPVYQKRVLYCTWELALAPMRERMRSIAKDTGLPDPLALLRDKSLVLFGPTREKGAARFDLTKPGAFAQLSDLVADARAEVLVIDTVAKVVPLAHKDTQGWHDIIRDLVEFSRNTGVALLCIDHAHRGRMEDHASQAAIGSQAKGAAFPVLAKLDETKDPEPRDKRWSIDVDSWYGDGNAPIWFRRPERDDGEPGAGCIPCDAPSAPESKTGGSSVDRWGNWLDTYFSANCSEDMPRRPKADVLEAATRAAPNLGLSYSKRTVERAYAEKIGGHGGPSGFQQPATWAPPGEGDDTD